MSAGTYSQRKKAHDRAADRVIQAARTWRLTKTVTWFTASEIRDLICAVDEYEILHAAYLEDFTAQKEEGAK